MVKNLAFNSFNATRRCIVDIVSPSCATPRCIVDMRTNVSFATGGPDMKLVSFLWEITLNGSLVYYESAHFRL